MVVAWHRCTWYKTIQFCYVFRDPIWFLFPHIFWSHTRENKRTSNLFQWTLKYNEHTLSLIEQLQVRNEHLWIVQILKCFKKNVQLVPMKIVFWSTHSICWINNCNWMNIYEMFQNSICLRIFQSSKLLLIQNSEIYEFFHIKNIFEIDYC